MTLPNIEFIFSFPKVELSQFNIWVISNNYHIKFYSYEYDLLKTFSLYLNLPEAGKEGILVNSSFQLINRVQV